MNKNIQKYIAENFSTIVKILVIYAIGIVIGLVLFNFQSVKNEYLDVMRNILDMTKQENFEGINIIANGLKNNIIFISLLHLSLLTFVAPMLVLLFVILKAIVTGIYIATLFSIFGFFKGIAAIFLGIVLPLLLSLMGYVVICTNIIRIFSSIRNGNFELKDIVKYIYWLIISFSLISFSLVIEQLMTTVILNIYSNI